MRSDYYGYLLLFIISVAFSYWFSSTQLHFVSPESAIIDYPTKYFLITMLRCVCTITIIFLFSYLILSIISKHKINILYTAASFTPLMFVYIGWPLLWIAFAVLFLEIILLLSILTYNRDYSLLKCHGSDFIVLIALFLLHLILSTAYSPLDWHTAWHTSLGAEEIMGVAPIFKNYVLAKQFVFSTMDYSQWAGTLNPPITLSSPFLAFLTLLLDLPSIDIESFRIVLLAVNFILIIAGSFGLYLFLKYAAKIHMIFAFFGGCLFYFSGAPFISGMIFADGGIFLSPYAAFPFALLLISLAFEKNNLALGCWSAVALDSQFFFLTPHPEGTIYSFLFYFVYIAGLYLFKTGSVRNKLSIAFASLVALLTCCAFVVIPIVIDQLTGNMHTFAHTADISANSYDTFKVYFRLIAIFIPISLLLLFVQKKLTPTYFAVVFLTIFLSVLLLLTTHLSFNNWLVNFLHIGLHIWFAWRIAMYLCLCSFIIVMYALDAITVTCMAFIVKMFPQILRAST